MEDLGKRAAAAVREKLGAGDELPGALEVVRATKPEFGDLQCNAALPLAKPLKKKPREIAQPIADALATHDAVAKTEIAGPGFVNIWLKDEWLAQHAADGLTLRQTGAGQRVVLDYSSPNVAKPMHVAHIRSTIVGDANQADLAGGGLRGRGRQPPGRLGHAVRQADRRVAQMARRRCVREERGQRAVAPVHQVCRRGKGATQGAHARR